MKLSPAVTHALNTAATAGLVALAGALGGVQLPGMAQEVKDNDMSVLSLVATQNKECQDRWMKHFEDNH